MCYTWLFSVPCAMVATSVSHMHACIYMCVSWIYSSFSQEMENIHVCLFIYFYLLTVDEFSHASKEDDRKKAKNIAFKP